jgi:nucleoid-associated protein YgaU
MRYSWQLLVVMALALSAFSFDNNSAAEQPATTAISTTTTTTSPPPTTTEPTPTTSTPTTSTTNPPSEPGPDEPTPEAGEETSREVVVEGDTLWTLAEAHMPGEPTTQEVAEYVAQVAKANRNRLQSGDPNLITPGETIILPPVASAPAQPAPEADRNRHDVAEGETLWTIAQDHLASARGGADKPTTREIATYWLRVVEANRDRLVSGDPDLIYPGEEIALPPVD